MLSISVINKHKSEMNTGKGREDVRFLCPMWSIYIYIYGHVPKPIVYEVHLERACAGGGVRHLFVFVCFFSGFPLLFPRGGTRGPPEAPKRGAPGVRQQVFGVAFLAPFVASGVIQ